MLWGGRWEEGSCLGTPVRIKDFKIKKNKKKERKKNKVFLIRKKKNSKSHMAFHSLWLKKGIA